jgi:hypothetical protein
MFLAVIEMSEEPVDAMKPEPGNCKADTKSLAPTQLLPDNATQGGERAPQRHKEA